MITLKLGDMVILGPSTGLKQYQEMDEQYKKTLASRGVLSNGQPIVHKVVTGSKAKLKIGGQEIEFAQTDQAYIGIDFGFADDEVRHLFNPPTEKEKVCECGAEKVNSPKHSGWCAKHADE